MLTKLIDIDDALNVVEMIIMRLADQSQWKILSDLARRELDAIPEAENAVISDISNIVVGTIENDNEDDATKIRKIRKTLADYYRNLDENKNG